MTTPIPPNSATRSRESPDRLPDGEADAGPIRMVRAGIRLERLAAALVALPPPPLEETPVLPAPVPVEGSPAQLSPVEIVPAQLADSVPAAPPPRHWLRVAGRGGLRLFRPLALPFLNRFEWRVRTAVEKTDFAAMTDSRLRALEGRVEGVDAALAREAADLARTLEALRTELTEQNARVATDFQRNLVELRTALTEQNARVLALGRETEARAAERLDSRAERLDARLDGLARDTGLLMQRGAVPLADGDYLVRTPWGWLVAPGEDERLLMALIENRGVLEPGTTAVLTALLRPGDTMVDVGAHIGTMTLPAARTVGPAGRVVTVEPGARAAALLRRSLHINSLGEQVSLHECAAGAASGEALLHISPVIGENSLVPPVPEHLDGTGAAGDPPASDHETARVAVRPLDDLVPPGPVRLVKIDAEGYEPEVWKGMTRIIAENPDLAVIVEFGPTHLARAGLSVAAWYEALLAPGFTAWEIDEASRTVRPSRPLAERAAVFSMNLLLSRGPLSRYPELDLSP